MTTVIPATSSEEVKAPLRVVAIAASAGGHSALTQLLGALPASFRAAIVLVQHISPHSASHAAEIFSRRTALHVKEAQVGDQLAAGWVYIAAPNHHLCVDADGRLSLPSSPLVHFCRPSADVMLESVAGSYGRGALAVILTGTGSDGSAGVQEIKRKGGEVIAQDPEDAQFNAMPLAAINSSAVDHVLPLDQIAAALMRWANDGTI